LSWQDPAPGEREAGERTWRVVREAFEERLPAPKRRDWRPFAIAAVAAAVVAAALSPPGQAVFGSIRDAVRGEENARPALFALPSAGSRILVNSALGAWVVQSDGSKRLLRGYRDAMWSPHGLYLAAVRGNELRALEPNGAVHWSIGRAGPIRAPQWSFDGFRIAYFAGGALRVVNGDGTGDHALTRAARPGVAAWQPSSHALAYVDRAGNIQIVNVDRPGRRTVLRTTLAPRQLAWTPDGRRLIAVGAHEVAVFGARGPQLRRIDRAGARVVAAGVSPDGREMAFVETLRGQSSLQLAGVRAGAPRRVFRGAGDVAGVSWAPDGKWLLLDWRSADQWLFIRSVAVQKIAAVSNVEANFGRESSIAGWCCP
jgi:Tol biopolymer transport system component